MPNAAIELHDTSVKGIRMNGPDVVLDVDAFVHVSDGEPGVDAGTGWSRPVRITVRQGLFRKNFDGEALWITDGTIRLGERLFENMLPLELDEAGTVDIDFVGGEGRLSVAGGGLRIEPTGEAEYVEEFSGSEGIA